MRAECSAIADVLKEPYRPGHGCRDEEPLQAALNALYDYRDDPETKVLHRSRLNLFHALMSRLVARGTVRRFDRALDVGCNAGYYSKMLSDLGFRDVLGVDIEPAFIEKANAHFGSEVAGRRRSFEVRNAERLDSPGAFDFILCTEVIEHTSRPEQVIAGLASSLAPGGIAVVTLPNRVSIPYRWAMLVHVIKRKPYDPVLRDHLSWPWTRSVRVLSPYGLELLETAGTNLFLFGPLLRALYRKPGFAAIHHLNDALSSLGPVHRWAQFFFTVWRKP